jgi:HD-like signal output (HDOD) protein
MAFVAALAREKLLITARTLPAAPQVLSELGELLQDVNTSLEEISDLLKRDAALAARIIRISNSSILGGGLRIGSVEEAVNRVGFGEVYRLVGLATTSRLADRDLNYYQIDAEALRLHMLYMALAAEGIASDIGMDSRQAYTAGLLRTLGMMVLDRIARERLPISEAYNANNSDGYAAWEGSMFSVSNCEVSALILGEWKFPTDIVSAVREHYLLRESDINNTSATVLNAAGWLTQQARHGLAGEAKYWALMPKKFEKLGLDEERLKLIGVHVQDEFERLKQVI